jgi:hypothetical protein
MIEIILLLLEGGRGLSVRRSVSIREVAACCCSSASLHFDWIKHVIQYHRPHARV